MKIRFVCQLYSRQIEAISRMTVRGRFWPTVVRIQHRFDKRTNAIGRHESLPSLA